MLMSFRSRCKAVTSPSTRLLNTQHVTIPPRLIPPRSPFAIPAPKPKIQFARLDFDNGLQTVLASPLPKYRCKFFMLRCVPSLKVGPPPTHPFPPREIGDAPEKQVVTVRFGIVTSKKAISKFAVERSKVRTLFKSAVDGVLRKEREGGRGSLIKSDMVYLAILYGDLLGASKVDLERDVSVGLKFISRPTAPKKSVPRPDILGRSTRYTPPNR